jgi:ADP-ribose pyrophosphatase YjhB (NUDIX family)
MYKIFFKDRVIHLTDQINNDLANDFSSILKYSNQGELRHFINDFEQDTTQTSAYIYWHNKFELLQNFKACFTNLPAAGGMVWNKELNRFIGMNRLNHFDLPKGKTEKNESFEETAIREVGEECNIHDIRIIKKLTSTYHTYRLNDRPIFKETKWFEMVYDGNNIPTPQTEENIESVFWVNPAEIKNFTSTTYGSIIEVLKKSERTAPFL